MNMQSGQYTLHDNAIGQLADKMGIPSRYLRQLASGDEWQRQLAATVLNEHSGWTQRTRVLIRTVGQQVRGVLSDSYRRLNSVEILTAFVQEASQQGAVIADAYMSDTKVWAETILPQPIVVPTVKNGEGIVQQGQYHAKGHRDSRSGRNRRRFRPRTETAGKGWFAAEIGGREC